MNFLDSLFDKIPFLRDMERSKRPIIAGFAVFAVMVILGIVIDAIASSGGGVTVAFIIIGFLLMAVIILTDYFLGKKVDENDLDQNDNYSFFEDLDDQNDYIGSVDPNAFNRENYSDDNQNQNMPEQFEVTDYGYSPTENKSNYTGYSDNANMGYNSSNQFVSNNEPVYENQPQDIEYTSDNEAFRSEFQFSNEPKTAEFNAPVISTESQFSYTAQGSNDFSYNAQRGSVYSQPVTPVQTIPPVQTAPSVQTVPPVQTVLSVQTVPPVQNIPSVQDDIIGKPVMTFNTPSTSMSDDIAKTADYVAPNISAPAISDNIGGPVMSIPMRNSNQFTFSEPAPKKNEYYAPKNNVPLYQQGERGQEIESFFDNMNEDELLYSDCVEVWASDAKPATVRLLKQIESMSDKKKADALGREAEYVNAVLDRIYYFTMLDSIKDNLNLKRYNFSAMVKECLRRFSPFFMEKRIGLLWKGLDIDIITDKRWLIFALTQVIFNAVEFTGLGGKIAISAKKEGSMIHLMVDDNGCGISDEDLPHIFMAGFMGDNVPNESGRRTGMGLFITRSVVEKLGGTVTAESTIEKGTRISIILPERP